MQKAQPFAVQIALQGGGAKIMALLAAMEGVQALEKSGTIKVTRIAGTSAGAIVGCLYATRRDMAATRKQVADILGRVVPKFRPPTDFGLAVKLFRGRPLWPEAALARELADFFAEAGFHTLGDFADKKSVEMIIVAASLSGTPKVVHSRKDEDIVSSLLNSCALPFCFRTWNKNGNPVSVDGGLCENLPAEELLDDEQTHGPVVAVSFDRTWSQPPGSLKTFSLALLDTAISNSVERTRRRLGRERVHSIATTLTTFDFTAAMAFSADAAYRIRDEAEKFLSGFVAARSSPSSNSGRAADPEIVAGDPWAEGGITTMENLWRVYQHQFATQPLTYEHSSFSVQANCVADPPGADFVRYMAVFKAAEHPIYCHSLGVLQTDQAITVEMSEVSVHDQEGKPVEFVIQPIRDPTAPTKRQALVFFFPPLEPGAGSYRLEFKQRVRDFMKPLHDAKVDELFTGIRRTDVPVGRMDLVLQIPKKFQHARLDGKEGGAAGRQMNATELAGYPAQPGFFSIGWTGQQVSSNQRFAVDVRLEPEKQHV